VLAGGTSGGIVLPVFLRVQKTLIVDLRAQWQKQLADRKLKRTADAEASIVALTIGADGRLSALRLDRPSIRRN